MLGVDTMIIKDDFNSLFDSILETALLFRKCSAHSQSKILIEECGELIQALSKYQRILQGDKTCQTDMCHAEYMITDEIADVELLLEQIKYLLGNEREVRERKLYKLDRTEQRLLE